MQNYKNQVSLLLDVWPIVAREECFAIHGGTAINLFVRDMPRLSVDIDLTYLPIEDREVTYINVSSALERIKANIVASIQNINVTHQHDVYKLQVSSRSAQIKIEVNTTGRGTLTSPQKMVLCDQAQTEFDVFCAMPVVPFGQLYGGKICAALDRQHPRDLFDVMYLLNNEGFSEEVKIGFLLCLASSGRPMHELIVPNYLDQRAVMINHFEGMTVEPFSYEEFEATRENLIRTIHNNLTDYDKEFLLSVKNLTPNWVLYDFERFPAVQWKLRNLEKLKAQNPTKHQAQYDELKRKLNA